MVSTQYIDTYLKDRFAGEVEWYNKKSIHNQRLAKIYQVLIIIFTVATTAFAAFELKLPTIASSSLAAIMLGILKYFKFEELWHNYRTTCESLIKEKILYESGTGPYSNSEAPERLFIERSESLISREHSVWTQIVCETENKKGKQK